MLFKSSSSHTKKRSQGCEILFEGAEPIIADIVFVHGLRGHRTDAWTNKENLCWPKELLPKEEGFSNVRILAFGYDADFVSFKQTSQNSLYQHARNLLYELVRMRSGNLEKRPIIFVAHSLGGLLVEEALDQSFNKVKPMISSIFLATRGVIFFGTPHRGSSKATWAKNLASLAEMGGASTNKGLVRDLEKNSQTLDRIGVGFSQMLANQPFKLISFTEELDAARIGGKVVEDYSAVVDDPFEVPMTIHANHMDMVKFSGSDDQGYKNAVFAITTLLAELPVESGNGLMPHCSS